MERYQLNVAFRRFGFIKFITGCMMTFCILLMAFVLNGDWLVVMIHLTKQLNGNIGQQVDRSKVDSVLESYYMKDISHFWISAMISGYGIYFLFGGFLHWHFYRRQRHQPEVWKCQPERWLPPELEIDEIKFGCLSLLITNTWSAMIACYIYNGGYSCVYYKFDEYGWSWWFLQWPIIFIYQDYITYWAHRWFHMPYLYTRFHKAHHKYKQPTAFSVTAIHPVEISIMQFILVLPLFTIPVHWLSFYMIALYTYYHGITTHSGINLKAHWWEPWQPDAIFHDNHHQYFHVNFGFNCFIWDKIHGTYRQADRIYREEIYYGKGKPIMEISAEELSQEIQERLTESKKAYDKEENPFLLTDFYKKSH